MPWGWREEEEEEGGRGRSLMARTREFRYHGSLIPPLVYILLVNRPAFAVSTKKSARTIPHVPLFSQKQRTARTPRDSAGSSLSAGACGASPGGPYGRSKDHSETKKQLRKNEHLLHEPPLPRYPLK